MSDGGSSNGPDDAKGIPSRWKTIVDYIKTSHELITILVCYLTVVGFHLSGPDLSVTYDYQELSPPAKLLGNLTQAASARPAQPIIGNAQTFASSPNLLRIELVNETATRVSDLELVINGVASVADTSLTSSSFALNADSGKLAAFTFSASQSALSFPNLRSLPPHAHVTLLIWGKFLPPLFGDFVRVSGAASVIEVTERRTTSGFSLFLARNAGTLTFIVIVYFLIATLRRARAVRTH